MACVRSVSDAPPPPPPPPPSYPFSQNVNTAASSAATLSIEGGRPFVRGVGELASNIYFTDQYLMLDSSVLSIYLTDQ